MEDLDALEEIAEFLDHHTEIGRRYGFAAARRGVPRSLLRELDYRQEAQNLTLLAQAISRSSSGIVVPAPIDDYTTSRVLTMEYVSGTKITTLSPVARSRWTVLRSPSSCSARTSSRSWWTDSSTPIRIRATCS